MLELTGTLLASGVKGIFENPGYLIGVPLVGLGILGALIALSPIELRWPVAAEVDEAELLPASEVHPNARVYLQVGIILAVVTAIEVAVYYIDMAEGAFLGVLLSLSGMKFVLVVLWFMHLRFDSRTLSVLFSGALALAVALFLVVLATLGSNLI